MGSHPIENIMQTTMESIRNMVDVNTIVGDTVVMGDGTVIIPISKVSFGFVAGGGEYGNSAPQGQGQKGEQPPPGRASDFPFAGGTGAGVCISPMAFLVVGEGEVDLLPVQFNSSYERLLCRVPEVVSQLKEMFSSKSSKDAGESSEAAAGKGSWFGKKKRSHFDEDDAVDEDYRASKDEL
jgi:sporulation protein YtfJ